jgi:diguanylate cyclase (GGDEF)-like protein
MATTNVSTFICDHRKKIQYVLSDALKLFTWAEINNLRDIFTDQALVKLNRLFDQCDMNYSVMNWELTPLMPIPYRVVYCSAVLWLDLIILRIADKPITSFFFDLTIDEEGADSLFVSVQGDPEKAMSNMNFTKLNEELINLQRSLQRKNIQMEELNERLEGLATTDSLTGLLNHRSILNRASSELVRTKRTRQYFGLVMFDVDDIKGINSQYGRDIGDNCLVEIARILKISIRTYDGVGRMGGDSFLMYFPLQSKEQLLPILQRIHDRLWPITIKVSEQVSFKPNVSIAGVCIDSAKYNNVQIPELLVKVDQALLQTKNEGKGEIKVFDYR